MIGKQPWLFCVYYVLIVCVITPVTIVGTLKVYCDNIELQKRTLLSIDKLRDIYRDKGSDLDYIETSRTYDTLRYGKRNSKLPFEFTFTDKYNHDWKIKMEKTDDTVTFMVPCGTHMLWYGADESPTRTGSDAQTSWAEVQFSYKSRKSGWWGTADVPAGVRISFLAYKDNSTGEWLVDTYRYNQMIDKIKKGLEITDTIIDQIEKAKGKC